MVLFKNCLITSLFFLCLLVSSCKDESIDPSRNHIYDTPADVCELTGNETSVINELNSLIHPIESSYPINSIDELQVLGETVGQAQFVGLGEATHGTREFFQMKDRIFRFLIEEYGFKAIGFEATWGGALHVNRYVVDGIGSSREAIAKMQFWTWDTEEVQVLVEWMRAYNINKTDENKIFFYGFDMQSGTEERFWIDQYLSLHDPSLATEVNNLIDQFLDKADFITYPSLSESIQNDLLTNLNNAKQLFLDNRDDLITASSEKEFELILQAFEILIQFEDVLLNPAARDFYMAQNSEWISNFIGGDPKIALWAHNSHISKSSSFESQGELLGQSQGSNYKNIGFSFSTGKFQAYSYDLQVVTTDNEIVDIQCNSTNDLLSRLENDNFYIVLEGLEEDSFSRAYFKELRPFINIGCCFETEGSPYFQTRLLNEFDVLIHFDKSSAAKPL